MNMNWFDVVVAKGEETDTLLSCVFCGEEAPPDAMMFAWWVGKDITVYASGLYCVGGGCARAAESCRALFDVHPGKLDAAGVMARIRSWPNWKPHALRRFILTADAIGAFRRPAAPTLLEVIP